VGRVVCPLCETRPVRRACPGVRNDICSVCCGTEREQTIDCPLDCEYLIAARENEKRPQLDEAAMPDPDVRVTDYFLNEHAALVVVIGQAIFSAAMQTPGVVDSDVAEAMAALVQTYRTAQSGLIYESRPANPIAAAVQATVQAQIAAFREEVARRSGTHSVRDVDVLGVIVFWRRVCWSAMNGRRKGRAFLSRLLRDLPPVQAAAEATESRLITP